MTIWRFASLAAAGVLAACSAEPEVAETGVTAPTRVDTTIAAPTGGPAMLTPLDANGDSRFDRAEYTAYGPANFNIYDTSRDNRIDLAEFATGWTNTGWRNNEQAFGAFDLNRDGALDSEEFFSGSSYTPLDRNSDGSLGTDEWLY